MNRSIVCVLACLLAMISTASAQQTDKPAKAEPSQEELEKQFAETMSGATLVGHFTITGLTDDKPPKEERYTLGKVAKLENGLWLFEARIQYLEHDVKLPLALPVKWAGDTPVITVTDVAFPGLGTYTARVIVYRGQYSGTWSGGTHGGHLFGRIVKEAEAKPAADGSRK